MNSLRVIVDCENISFTDKLQGLYQQNLRESVGDFVIHRGDDITSYHLCTVVDDFDTGITEVVRGVDLIESTPRQIYLQQLLQYKQPDYLHLPLACNNQGEKLSKQTYAMPVTRINTRQALYAALDFLGQSPPVEINSASPEEIIRWARYNWKPENIPALHSQTAPSWT